LRRGNVGVVATDEVAARAEEAVALVTQVEETLDLDQLAGVVLARFATAAPLRLFGTLTVATAAPTPATVARLLVVTPLLVARLGLTTRLIGPGLRRRRFARGRVAVRGRGARRLGGRRRAVGGGGGGGRRRRGRAVAAVRGAAARADERHVVVGV